MLRALQKGLYCMKSTLYTKSILYAGEKYEQCQAILKINKTIQNFLDYLLFYYKYLIIG